jgi:hypothetical protein
MKRYAAATLAKLFYSARFGYHFYVYYGPDIYLPANYTKHYLRVVGLSRLFELGHPYVLYSDLDSFMTFSSAVPVEAFLIKDLNLQDERLICSAIILIKNTPWSKWFLHTWWALGSSGCCAMKYYDQNSYAWLIAQVLQPFTVKNISRPLVGHLSSDYPYMGNIRDYPHIHFTEMVLDGDELPSKPTKRIKAPLLQLHNCLHQWKGCKSDSPALFYHTSSDTYHKVHQLVVNVTLDWIVKIKLYSGNFE